ncbi:MAG TPA: quinoprotein dehydrogenase-associated SoxYZ-like carrier [Methylocella sp.]|nr:quinoprotein dehydrogenase-associated SoxYZ-like carrier [Methylocella sp.]
MTRFALAGIVAGAMLFANASVAQDDEAARAARWNELAQDIFGAKQIQQGNAKIALEAPERAEDAALVPVTIRVKNPKDVKSITLVIDDNPAPVAAHVTFGPAGDPQSLKLRVRVNQYTYMHAVEETNDGALYETHRFVKASGGCSAPSGSYDAAALAEIGQMKLHFLGKPQEGHAREAQLLIRHPNFNGMQKDPATQGYTPARFLKTVDVTLNGTKVLHLDSDISLAADPAITFGVNGPEKGKLAIEAHDSNNAVFEHNFDLGTGGSS